MQVTVNEVFKSIQGEGPRTGRLTVFVRLSGCNLKCEWCDTKYASKGQKIPVQYLTAMISEYRWLDVTWTGGEPTLQQKAMNACMNKLWSYNHHLETNGYYLVNPDKYTTVVVSPKQDQWTSEMLDYYKLYDNVYWKFVVGSSAEFEMWDRVVVAHNLDRRRVFFMPKGETKAKQRALMKPIAEWCVVNGFNFSPRLHTLIWGKKRGI